MTPGARRRVLRGRAVVAAISLLAFLAVVVLNGWVGDDAFITLRTVRNFVEGRGLGYNPGERVQVYTHPLWMFALAGAYAVTREAFWTTLALSVLTSAGAAAIVLGALRRRASVLLVGVVMTCSRAYVEYATSGLENPLTHLLIALAGLRYLGTLPGARQVGGLALLTSLAGLCRLDAVLLFAPMLVAAAAAAARRGCSRQRLARALLVGATPLVAWEAFSLVYYGALVPNTALAKLGTGIPLGERWLQGLRYLQVCAEVDPLTAATIVYALALALRQRWRGVQPGTGPLALGILAHLLYVIWIGGDFMLGRFLSAPLCLALWIVGAASPRRPGARRRGPIAWLVVWAATTTFALAGERLPARTRAHHHWRPGQPRARHGVVDERSFYAAGASVLSYRSGRSLPDHRWRRDGARRGDGVVVFNTPGYFGFYASPGLYIIDRFALTDPLLARLPALRRVNWKPGHFARALPAGYVASRKRGQNLLRDPELAALYDALLIVHAGPLLSARRWRELLRLHTGYYRRRVDLDRYRWSELVTTPLRDRDRGRVAFLDAGVRVALPERRDAARIKIELSCGQTYRVRVLEGDHERTAVEVTTRPPRHDGALAEIELVVPEEARTRGYDALHVVPLTMTGRRRLELGRVVVP